MARIRVPRRSRPPAPGREAGGRLLLALGALILLLGGLLWSLAPSARSGGGLPGVQTRDLRGRFATAKASSYPVAPKPPIASPNLPAAPAPKAVILIDDMGQSLEAARELLAIDLPISFAVLPFLPHSRQIALEAKLRGREFLLHLPMEPLDYPEEDPGPGGLLLSQGPNGWRLRTRAALEAVPGVAGVSNHMGSRLTERTEAMEVILGEVKARGLYFVDSYTTPRSVAYDVARRIGLRAGRRTVFLDNEVREDRILAQIDRLIEEAKRKGGAIGLAHPFKETIAALRKAIPRIRESGVKIVPPGDLVN